MKFLVDECFNALIGRSLQGLGHGVCSLGMYGLDDAGMPDIDVLDFALRNAFVLLTHNRKDFKALHPQGTPHAGTVACKRSVPGAHEIVAEDILAAATEHGTLEGVYVSVTNRPT